MQVSASAPDDWPLENVRHEKFCQLIALGHNASEAYRLASPDPGENADVHSARWMVKDSIQNRIRAIRGKSSLSATLSIAEKRAFLAAAVRTPIGQVDESSPLCQAVKISPEGGREYKMIDKLRALELDSKISGELVDAGPINVLTQVNIGIDG